jgi:hypothetical protein
MPSWLHWRGDYTGVLPPGEYGFAIGQPPSIQQSRRESMCIQLLHSFVAALHTLQYNQIVPSAVALTCRFLRVRFTTAVTCNNVPQAIGCG